MTAEERKAPGEIDVETLRAGFAARSAEPPSAAAGPCPEAGTIYDAIRGRLAPRELREVVEHVAACPRCAQEWRLAMAFEEAAAEDDSVPDVYPAAARPRSPLRLVSVAAALVIAILAAGVWYTGGHDVPEEAPVFRDAGPGEIIPLVPDGAALDRDAPVLRWRLGEEGAPEGTTYDVLVSTQDGDAVAEADGLEDPRYALPAETVQSLPPGTVLEWLVDAHLPDGSRVRSKLFSITLRPLDSGQIE